MSTATTEKMPLATLTAMVVGGMVGAGVFSIPRNFAMATGVYGALIAWTIAGVGMLMLAFVFQKLANRKPDLDAGVYAYARAGFGPYLGFASAFGYWASACVGNVSYWVLIKSTLGAVFPFFGDGNTISAVAVSSVGIWAFYFLVLRGTKEAAAINKIVTIAKVIPLLLFLVLAIFAFKPDVFAANLWGGTGVPQDYLHAHGDLVSVKGAGAAARDYGSLFEQVKATMLITVFVFLGIEGASNYSRFAQEARGCGQGHRGRLSRRAGAVRVGVHSVVRRDAARRDPGVEPALGGRRARCGGRPVGRGLHRRGRHRLGARRVPGLDADGGRGAVHCRQEGRHAGLPGQGECGPGADQRAVDEHAAGAARTRRDAVLGRCLHLRAVAVQPPVAADRTCCRQPTC